MLAIEITKKPEAVRVATLLIVIGEACEVFSLFSDWREEGDRNKLEPVLNKFEEYCQPHKNVPFERYRFNRQVQEPGETYDQYRTALQKLAERCEFSSITPNEILRDQLVFGIRDAKTRERLLRQSGLTLAKTDEIGSSVVNSINTDKLNTEDQVNTVVPQKSVRDCWNCGRQHKFHRKELCPAYGKSCNKCHRLNHFAAKCWARSKGANTK